MLEETNRRINFSQQNFNDFQKKTHIYEATELSVANNAPNESVESSLKAFDVSLLKLYLA